MTKLNWRDASKELPDSAMESFEYMVCIKKISGKKFISVSGISYDLTHPYYFRESNDEQKVTHWLPIEEIPLPKED